MASLELLEIPLDMSSEQARFVTKAQKALAEAMELTHKIKAEVKNTKVSG